MNAFSAQELVRIDPVIPVIVLDDVQQAVPLARALLAGGVQVLEVTLRTPAALDCIRAIANEVPEAIVGAGTIVNAADIDAAVAAGARFGVSPGVTHAVLARAQERGLALLPGTSNASNIMTALEFSMTTCKFFPAKQSGGVEMLKALGGPFPQITFCPTGGIDVETAPQYLALKNVACVGGSWLTPASLVKAGQWGIITELARETAQWRTASTHATSPASPASS